MNSKLKSMIRVNQAGEAGAVRIYEGQQAVLSRASVGPIIQHMKQQEQDHLRLFNDLAALHHVRKTALSPLWHVAGYALGYGSALLGKRAAMACTVAVEEVIDEHYKDQLNHLQQVEGVDDLKAAIEKCHQEELEHRDTGLEHDAQKMAGYEAFVSLVKIASKTAIFLSKRI